MSTFHYKEKLEIVKKKLDRRLLSCYPAGAFPDKYCGHPHLHATLLSECGLHLSLNDRSVVRQLGHVAVRVPLTYVRASLNVG